MPQPDVFGVTVTPPMVERAVIATLKLWLPTYLRHLEKVEGFKAKALPDVKSWRAADTMEERFPEQQIPAVQVMLTNDVKLVTEAETGHAVFGGTVDVLVESSEPEPVRRLASIYAWAIGLCLDQKSGLDGSVPIDGFGWASHNVPALGRPSNRWLALGSVDVAFAVKDAFNPLAGPTEPSDEPPNWPVATKGRLILDPED